MSAVQHARSRIAERHIATIEEVTMMTFRRTLAVALIAAAPVALSAQGATSKGGATQKNTTANAERAKCKDGTMYSGASRQGACSSHGGVAEWYTGPKAVPPKGATARCGDGTYYTKAERQGACSGHKGVAEWLKKG
jgi:hypothetical protein